MLADMNRLYGIALFAIGAMCMVAAFLAPHGSDAPTPVATAKHKVAKVETDALMLRRDASGQFHLDATVRGNSVNFLIDTGADMVALTEEEATNLGLDPAPDQFQPVMQTASGVGYGAPIKIDELEVAGTTLHDVDAVVVRGLSVNLLGQSVLRQLGGVELKGDTMVIRSN
jgi:aspartyl protease family protein